MHFVIGAPVCRRHGCHQSTDDFSPEWEPYATAAKKLSERTGSPGGAAYTREAIDDHDTYAESSARD